jgi:AcrR family transcriptional regulator
MGKVKKRRTYDSRGRKEKAESSRAQILTVARRAFLEKGYAATTIAEIALAADVSPETIYKTFGGKAGLVRAIHERALEGSGPTPAPRRSDDMSDREEDPHVIVKRWGAFIAEVSPLASPVMLLVRAAAESDPALADLVRDIDVQRLERMTANARKLARRGFLREGVSVARAGDIMWAWTAAEIYDLFVLRRGWSPAELGAYVAEMLAAALLPSAKSAKSAKGAERDA